MIYQCAGKSRAGVLGGLIRCEYDAVEGGFCYFHSKVDAGLITTIDGKPGHELSWKPTPAAKNPGSETLKTAVESHVERVQLLNEWDDETTATAISMFGAAPSGSHR